MKSCLVRTYVLLPEKDGLTVPYQTRCDGTLPGCKTCEVYKVVCCYEKPPPMSQIVAMASKLQESERMVKSCAPRFIKPKLSVVPIIRHSAHQQHLQVPRALKGTRTTRNRPRRLTLKMRLLQRQVCYQTSVLVRMERYVAPVSLATAKKLCLDGLS